MKIYKVDFSYTDVAFLTIVANSEEEANEGVLKILGNKEGVVILNTTDISSFLKDQENTENPDNNDNNDHTETKVLN